MKKSLYEKMLEVYEKYYEEHNSLYDRLNVHKEAENWSKVAEIDGRIHSIETYATNIKKLLKEFFSGDVESQISTLTEQYDEERRMNRSIAMDYGSELAGDFSKNEYKIINKINVLKSILK